MPTITRFEDLEIWQLARAQCNDFNSILKKGTLAKDFELKNQMDASSGSVMDCIAEGFERSGNAEFKNFLVIAKGSNGEFRSQLYRCLDRQHVTAEKFDELYQRNVTLGNKIMSFINYLQNCEFKGLSRRIKPSGPNLEHQTSNLEHRTSNIEQHDRTSL
jgi:four helix bundle protein